MPNEKGKSLYFAHPFDTVSQLPGPETNKFTNFHRTSPFERDIFCQKHQTD